MGSRTVRSHHLDSGMRAACAQDEAGHAAPITVPLPPASPRGRAAGKLVKELLPRWLRGLVDVSQPRKGGLRP